MIMIFGSNHDDVLYFENVIKDRKEETVFQKYQVVIGTIFNQEVVLVKDIYSSYVSSAVISYLIEKYFVILVFVVGKCKCLDSRVKKGDIVVSKSMLFSDVDFTEDANVKLCQIPNFPDVIEIDHSTIQSVEAAFEKRTFSHSNQAVFACCNTHYNSKKNISHLLLDDKFLGIDDIVVFDSEIGGVAIACSLFNIPFIGIKAVESTIDKKPTLDDYIFMLKQYASIGKAVVSCIGEIGHNDILRGDGDE